MNIGDYVRTKKGIIGKIVKEEPFMDTILIFLDNKQGNITLQNKDGVFKVNHIENIIKSSPNIIDLIEVGDYINGSKLLEIDYAENEEGNCDKIHYYYYFEDNDKDVNEYYENLEVKSIVTREMFESMEYKIGE